MNHYVVCELQMVSLIDVHLWWLDSSHMVNKEGLLLSEAAYSFLWLNTTIFLKSQTVYLLPEADIVAGGQSPQCLQTLRSQSAKAGTGGQLTSCVLPCKVVCRDENTTTTLVFLLLGLKGLMQPIAVKDLWWPYICATLLTPAQDYCRAKRGWPLNPVVLPLNPVNSSPRLLPSEARLTIKPSCFFAATMSAGINSLKKLKKSMNIMKQNELKFLVLAFGFNH